MDRSHVVGLSWGYHESACCLLQGGEIVAAAAEELRDRIIAEIKGRESFRPFAPAVPVDHATESFDVDSDSLLAPFMLESCRSASSRPLDVVTHVDGTARIQIVDPESSETSRRFAALLPAFGRNRRTRAAQHVAERSG